MSEKKHPQNAKAEERIDDLDAALEESKEQHEESTVVEEADANQDFD
jgi:hypothetical protein